MGRRGDCLVFLNAFCPIYIHIYPIMPLSSRLEIRLSYKGSGSSAGSQGRAEVCAVHVMYIHVEFKCTLLIFNFKTVRWYLGSKYASSFRRARESKDHLGDQAFCYLDYNQCNFSIVLSVL